MEDTWGIVSRWSCAAALLLGMLCAVPAVAQETPDDAAAREYFERGREAFEQANYEGALVFFRHAYRLSGRPALQYNIGVAADRLQREQEALEAFQHYLEETESPTREAEVRGRIEALQESIAEREATERALEEAAIRYQTVAQKQSMSDGRRLPRSTIIGGTVLAVFGVAGVAAMSVGLAQNGSCSTRSRGTVHGGELSDGLDIRLRGPRHRGLGRKRDLVCDRGQAREGEAKDAGFVLADRADGIRNVLKYVSKKIPTENGRNLYIFNTLRSSEAVSIRSAGLCTRGARRIGMRGM